MLNNVFFKNNSWNYISKEVNYDNYQIVYVTHGGYATKKAAESAYIASTKKFEKAMDNVRKATGVKYTFKSYLDYWFQFILQGYGQGSYQSVTSWAIYQIIFPLVENDILLSAVNADYVNSILEKTKQYSIHAPNIAKKAILLALRDANSDGLMRPIDPASIISCPSPRKKLVVYSKEQIRLLLDTAKRNENIYLEILLALFCGLRSGEILGLKYSDFDFEKNTVTVNRQITRDYDVRVLKEDHVERKQYQSIKPPKSMCSHRTIRVPSLVMEQVVLRKRWNMMYLRKKKCTHKWKDYLCIGMDGNIKCTSTFREALRRICTLNNLQPISPHDLRHLYAGILIEQQVPIDRISKLMGHRHTRTTFEIYCSIIESPVDTVSYIEHNLDPVVAAQYDFTYIEGMQQ